MYGCLDSLRTASSNLCVCFCAHACLQDSVTLRWQAPADNGSAITFYKLEMDDGRGGDFHHVYGGQSEQLSAMVTGLQVRTASLLLSWHVKDFVTLTMVWWERATRGVAPSHRLMASSDMLYVHLLPDSCRAACSTASACVQRTG